jgi:hypothetical protein
MNYTRITLFAVVALGAGVVPASGQIITYPHVQNFDLVIAPALPPGWTSSQNRTPGVNDFTTTTSTVRSLPNAVLSTNATVGQELRSPAFDFTSFHPDSMHFYTRRSGTHNAPVVVEASLNNGATYPIPIGDTVVATGSTNYVVTSLALPEVLAGNPAVRLRWRILPDGSGTTGTLRIDDLTITAKAAHDLALHAVRTVPEHPVEGDSITCLVVIRNVGREEAAGFVAKLFHDTNNDSIPQPGGVARHSGHKHRLPCSGGHTADSNPTGDNWTQATSSLIALVEYAHQTSITMNDTHHTLRSPWDIGPEASLSTRSCMPRRWDRAGVGRAVQYS